MPKGLKDICIKLTAPNKCTECGRKYGIFYIGNHRYWCVYCNSVGRKIYQAIVDAF